MLTLLTDVCFRPHWVDAGPIGTLPRPARFGCTPVVRTAKLEEIVQQTSATSGHRAVLGQPPPGGTFELKMSRWIFQPPSGWRTSMVMNLPSTGLGSSPFFGENVAV